MCRYEGKKTQGESRRNAHTGGVPSSSREERVILASQVPLVLSYRPSWPHPAVHPSSVHTDWPCPGPRLLGHFFCPRDDCPQDNLYFGVNAPQAPLR